jgi:hypothetical protein
VAYASDEPLPVLRPGPSNGLVSSILFGTGTALVIVFLFLPLMDRTNVGVQRARLNLAQQKNERKEREAAKRDMEAKPPGDPNAQEKARRDREEQRESKRRAWENERERLQTKIDEADAGARVRLWWYELGMMPGFLILAAGSLCFLHPRHTTTRRVVGAVVLSAVVLLIFIRVVIGLPLGGF